MPYAVLPALWCVFEVWKVSDDPGIDLLYWERTCRRRFNSHEDETGERIGGFCMGVYSWGGGRRLARGTGRGGDTVCWRWRL